MAISREALNQIDFSDVAAGGRLEPVHPGDVLMEDFIVPLGLTRYKVAKLAGVQQWRTVSTRADPIDLCSVNKRRKKMIWIILNRGQDATLRRHRS